MEDDLVANQKQDDGKSDKQENVAGPTTTPSGNQNNYGRCYARTAWKRFKASLQTVANWRKRDSAYWTATATIVMAITTGVYTYYARKQWQEMKGSGGQTDRLLSLYSQQLDQLRRQAGDTHELAAQAKTQADRTRDVADRMKDQSDRTKDLADRMKDQANETKEIARISKNELVDVQRAFISVTSLDPKVIPNGAYTWTLTVENSGSTNAQHLEMSRNCGTPGTLGIKWLDFLDFSKHLPTPQSLEIGPHSSQTLGFCAAIPSLVDGPDRPWIMFGKFTYADIFGGYHLTEFCYQSFGYGAMIPCEGINSGHNCTDKDCKDFKKTKSSPRATSATNPN